jgi:thiamine phosphate synthase YjbQ (UPF0047 family)
MLLQEKLSISTKGFNDIIDITPSLRTILKKSGIRNGHVIVFVPGSTGG